MSQNNKNINNSEDIGSQIEALRKEIERHNYLYYDLDSPEISDAAYDALLRRLEELEQAAGYDADSPTQHVGGSAQSSFAKVRHTVPLLSLKDVFSFEEVEAWASANTDAISASPDACKFVVENKVDGLSLAIRYEKGRFVQAMTRGDGLIGEDVTKNAEQIISIPKTVPFEGTLIVRAEVVMPFHAFEKVNKEMVEKGQAPFANPRNAAAGTLRSKNPNLCRRRGLEIVAFSIMYSEPQLKTTELGDIGTLNRFGFPAVFTYPCGTLDGVKEAIENIGGDLRNFLTYGIDGAVIKYNDIPTQTRLGENSKFPLWAVAYKYPPEQKETVIRDIITQTGRTGTITPVAVFDPILLNGTSVSRATLHNQDYMDVVLGGIGIGDSVVVHKSGEIIPEVLRVVREKRPPETTDFAITKCPVCGAKAVLAADDNGNGSVYICSNDKCPAKLERQIEYWASKRVMDIDGLGPAAIHALVEAGKLNGIPDIYRLTQEDLESCPAIGAKKAAKLIAAIEASKACDIDRFIAGLGISGVGRTIGRELAKRFDSMESVIAASEDELSAIEGIGPLTACYISGFFADAGNAAMVRELEALGVNMKSLERGEAKPGVFDGMKFVFTGTLPTLSREEASKLVTDNGGQVVSGVSSKINVLVAGDSAGSKLDKAQSLGIPIWSEAELLSKLS